MRRKKIVYEQGQEVFRCIVCGRFLSVAVKTGITNKCKPCHSRYILNNRKYGAVKITKNVLTGDEMIYVIDRCKEVMKGPYISYYAFSLGFDAEDMPCITLLHIIDSVVHYDPSHLYPKLFYKRLIMNYLSNFRAKKNRYVDGDYENKIKLKMYNNNQPSIEDVLCLIN